MDPGGSAPSSSHRAGAIWVTWPFSYLQVHCDALIETGSDLVSDVLMGAGWRMMPGEELGEEPGFNEAIRVKEIRVVLECTPYATFATPSRHLISNDKEEKLTHWLSGSVSSDADEPACVGTIAQYQLSATPRRQESNFLSSGSPN